MKVYSVALRMDVLVAVDENDEIVWLQQNQGNELTRIHTKDFPIGKIKFNPSDYHEISLVEDF
jgi:hypothetical protein